MAYLGKLSDAEYCEVEGIRNSDLGYVKKSINHYLNRDIDSEKDSFRIGRAFHCFLLEPEVFEIEKVVLPDTFDRRSKERKEQYDGWVKAKRLIVWQSELDNFEKMKESLLAHPKIGNILTNSENEGVYTSEVGGVKKKVKVDIQNKGFIFDLKTCNDASPEAFATFITKYDTARQLTFYQDTIQENGVTCNGVGIIAIEKEAPFNCAVYTIDNATLDHGRSNYKSLVKKLSDYLKDKKEGKNPYTGYSQDVEVLTAKPWYFYE